MATPHPRHEEIRVIAIGSQVLAEAAAALGFDHTTLEAHWHDAIEMRVTRSHERVVEKESFTFRSQPDAEDDQAAGQHFAAAGRHRVPAALDHAVQAYCSRDPETGGVEERGSRTTPPPGPCAR
ncbi:hypothetical protein ABZ379_45020 [Streptomyces canus]|uniref:hypothetical protein n=1 Tax=Streptomyces canus TaxID=58343 RepID=UPI0033F688D8